MRTSSRHRPGPAHLGNLTHISSQPSVAAREQPIVTGLLRGLPLRDRQRVLGWLDERLDDDIRALWDILEYVGDDDGDRVLETAVLRIVIEFDDAGDEPLAATVQIPERDAMFGLADALLPALASLSDAYLASAALLRQVGWRV